jgi:hypothetical protein
LKKLSITAFVSGLLVFINTRASYNLCTFGTIKVRSIERLDSEGLPIEVPMTISSSKTDTDGHLNELWLVGSFMRVPLYQLKLSKQDSGKWMLEVIDFSSKDSVDEMLPNGS